MANEKRHWLGLDLGGTKMLAAVYDAGFKELAVDRKKTRGAEGADAGIERIIQLIEEVLAEAKRDPSDLAGIGVGVPGPLDPEAGVIVEAPNLGWRNVPLRERLQRKFKVPVALANDVDAGTFGEYRFGAAQKARCAVGVFPGTGIGGGCVYEGRILRGRNRSCMEIGHLPVEPEGRLCGCGRRGCLETVASRLAIAAEAAAAAHRGDAPNLLKEAGTDVAAIRSGALAQAIKAGDKAVEAIVRQAARRLGVAIAGVVNLLAPDIVVLGGGLVEAMEDLYLEEVRKAVRKGAMESFADTAQVVAARLNDSAVVMGSAALAEQAAST